MTQHAMTPLNPALDVHRDTTIGGPDSGRTQRELWEATSADGQWRYVREDTRRSPWLIEAWSAALDRWVEVSACWGSLDAARWATTQPAFLADFAVKLARLVERQRAIDTRATRAAA